MMRRRFSPLSAMPIAGTLLVPPAQAQNPHAAQAAQQGPILDPVSAAANPILATPADPAAAVQGRRALSTAFVRLGPGGHLLVELRNGHVLRLRDVTMGKKAFCGVVGNGLLGRRRCTGYADVATARAVDAGPRDTPVPAGSGASAIRRGPGGR